VDVSPGLGQDLFVERALTSIASRGWRRLTITADFVALAGGSLLALDWAGHGTVRDLGFAAVYVACVLGLTRGPQLLTERLLASGFDSCLDAVRTCSVGIMLATATGTLLGFGRPTSLALELWLVTLVAVCVVRLVLSLGGQRARRHGVLMTPTLVVGAGLVGARMVRRLLEKPEYGLLPIGFLDADPMPGAVDLEGGVPVLGAPDELAEVCAQTGARHVILAFASERDYRLVELIKRCRELGVGVSVVPRMYESVNERAQLDHVGGLPLLSLKTVDPKGWQFAIKHAIDRLGALVALITLSPVLAGIALAVKFTSPGPVIFRQRRVGRDGRIFDVLKFRTMTDAPSTAEFRLAPGSAPGGVEGTDRRTPIGRWLRSTSLDELPQLWNVLRGDMSLVGPRPERPEFAEQFERDVHGYRHRHRVKSGITGWAQVNGLRGQTSIADRVEWDNHYIENWSLGLELRTIALTLAEILRFREDGPRTLKRELQAQAAAAEQKPALQLISDAYEEHATATWFCGYCGVSPAGSDAPAPAPVARVCGVCGQGLMLESRADVAPRDDEAFIVVDSRLTVQAVSQHAERVLGISEHEATDRPVAELLVGADAERGNEESLTTLLGRAALSEEDPQLTFVRPRGTFGVRLRARISACGPPRAALLVFESTATVPSRAAHLRLVPADARAAESSA
jgi:exopolysaccharide biosynthesis polyprenyl glycosylphosphotransferase